MAPDRLTSLKDKTRYDPAEVEQRIFDQWLEAGYFHPEAKGTSKENFSVSIPPPNITGSLHMGHALNGAIQDALVRMRRMQGKNTIWVLGTDHASIATHAVVEKQLQQEGTSRKEIGREAFEERVWRWKEEYGSQIVEQFKRLGASCDYERERFTLDPGYVRAVYRVFKALYDKGYIYKDHYMVNWDPAEQTAISDLEVEYVDVEDELFVVSYPLAEGGGSIDVATVRPETMFADTAVAVNPDDKRYSHLIGKRAVLPLAGRELEIIADEHVDPQFGTGALKITPGHDPNDFEIGRMHGLEEVLCIGEDGRLTDVCGERFAGLTVLEGRKATVEALKEQGLIVRSEPYTHSVGHSHRSGEPVEPLISEQWFCRMDELAAPAIAAVKQGRVKITPERWARVYLDWMERIRPWCISRQLWWGHRLPVWYCDECEETYVAEQAPDRCGACDGVPRQEEDVLDTWFSSALWPFATLGWPEDSDEMRAFYPTDFLTTAREILFLWVARMVMMGLEFAGDVPFDDVYVHSVILAPDGRRMSKSLGTGIDPIESIEEHGADALRFGLLVMTSTQDVRFSEEKVQQGQDLANKLWNASRLILMNVEEVGPRPTVERLEDSWALSRLNQTVKQVTEMIDAYDFSHAALNLYDFIWHDLCDWYLESVKQRLYDASDKSKVSANLLYVLGETLALLHPVMPFVTEEIYSLFPKVAQSAPHLVVRSFPVWSGELQDEKAELEFGAVIEAVTELRRYREQVGLAASARPQATVTVSSGDGIGPAYSDNLELIKRLSQFDLAVGEAKAPALAKITLQGGSVEIHEGTGVDASQAQRRVAERREYLKREIERAQTMLANEGFTKNAPQQVVQKERDTLERCGKELDEL